MALSPKVGEGVSKLKYQKKLARSPRKSTILRIQYPNLLLSYIRNEVVDNVTY